eukprot:3803330-Pyramimonas_sp.AAC.1
MRWRGYCLTRGRANRVERRASRGRPCHKLKQRGGQRHAQNGTELSAANMARTVSRSGTRNTSI